MFEDMDLEPVFTRTWTIKLWDGYSRLEYQRYGTYEQVTAHLRALPEHNIWSAS